MWALQCSMPGIIPQIAVVICLMNFLSYDTNDSLVGISLSLSLSSFIPHVAGYTFCSYILLVLFCLKFFRHMEVMQRVVDLLMCLIHMLNT